MFHLKLARYHGEIKKGFLITRAQNVFIHKDLISNIFYNSVHLVYQKIKETKSFPDFAVQAGLFFSVEHPVLIDTR
jgi:hypothetical protein